MDRLWNFLAQLELRDLLWVVAVFLATFVLSLAVVSWLLVLLPATYFVERDRRPFWVGQPPVVRWSGLIAKNLLGAALVAGGVVLSLPGIPGQGLLTILIGVMLLDFPGKRKLERKIVGMPRVLRTINRLRARFGKPPLVL
jgi:hypothetical protein